MALKFHFLILYKYFLRKNAEKFNRCKRFVSIGFKMRKKISFWKYYSETKLLIGDDDY